MHSKSPRGSRPILVSKQKSLWTARPQWTRGKLGGWGAGDQLSRVILTVVGPALLSLLPFHTSSLRSCHLLAELQVEREMQYLSLLAPGLSEHFSAAHPFPWTQPRKSLPSSSSTLSFPTSPPSETSMTDSPGKKNIQVSGICQLLC